MTTALFTTEYNKETSRLSGIAKEKLNASQKRGDIVKRFNEQGLKEILENNPFGVFIDHMGHRYEMNKDEKTIDRITGLIPEHADGSLVYIPFEGGNLIFQSINIITQKITNSRINRPYTSFIRKGLSLNPRAEFYGYLCGIIPEAVSFNKSIIRLYKFRVYV